MGRDVFTSDDVHLEIGFGDPVDVASLPPFAVSMNPGNLNRVEIDGVAAARSWVSLTFGNYVFPPTRQFDERSSRAAGVALVDPELLELAEGLLECRLRQVCVWG